MGWKSCADAQTRVSAENGQERREGRRLSGNGENLSAARSVNVLVETPAGTVCRNIRFQAGGGFQPVFNVMARGAAVLLIEVVGVIANNVLAWLGGRTAGLSGLFFMGDIILDI
jgi:hypothetical protein